MTRYRYRTRALHGPWRATRDEAVADAVRAGLLVRRNNGSAALRWRTLGEIEEDAGEP